MSRLGAGRSGNGKKIHFSIISIQASNIYTCSRELKVFSHSRDRRASRKELAQVRHHVTVDQSCSSADARDHQISTVL